MNRDDKCHMIHNEKKIFFIVNHFLAKYNVSGYKKENGGTYYGRKSSVGYRRRSRNW
ncbi:hypothetical protein C5L34_002498 [Lentilactobacillus hilgardii]|nr:hypothetical protein C5L34_002498 [Lentilactobacillus hilgardii]